MYAGAAGHVDAEEYLTGRAVDKTFEQFKLGGAEPIGLGIILIIIIYFSSFFIIHWNSRFTCTNSPQKQVCNS